MSCKALLNTVLNTPTAVSANGTIPVGTAAHGFGDSISINGNGISLRGSGYFVVTYDITASPTAVGDFQISALLDGASIPGAIAISPSVAAGDSVTLPIQFVIYKPCACSGIKTITFVSNSNITVQSASAIVRKA